MGKRAPSRIAGTVILWVVILLVKNKVSEHYCEYCMRGGYEPLEVSLIKVKCNVVCRNTLWVILAVENPGQ